MCQCVPMCLLHVCQLRPCASALFVSAASLGVCFICVSCVPRCLLHVCQCVPRRLFHVCQLRPYVSASFVSYRDTTKRLTFAPPGQTEMRKDKTHNKYRDTTRRLTSTPLDEMEGNTHGREQYHTLPSRKNRAGEEGRRRTMNQGILEIILHQGRSASPQQRGTQLLYPKHDRETQLIPWHSAVWDAPDTSSLSENWKWDETKVREVRILTPTKYLSFLSL